MPHSELIPLLLPALHGIAALHAAGIVHRDLKPDNIFLCETEGDEPGAKVLDFGIAKAVDEVRPRLTRAGAILGTPAYMAPEQLLDAGAVDQRADVYAVGVILYRGLTGRRPFEADNIPALVGKVLYDEVEPPSQLNSDVPEALSRVVMRALSRDRDERFGDIETLVEALTGALLPVGPAPAPVIAPPREPKQWIWLGTIVALLIMATMVGPLLYPRVGSDPFDHAPSTTEPALADTHG